MMLFFRTDMNDTIATGHVMRCLSIADAAKEKGVESCFILSDDNAAELIEKKGYRTIVLGSQWDDLEAELPEIIEVIKEKKIDSIFVDSYMITEKYMNELKKYVKVASFDDLGNFTIPADLIINYDAWQNEEEYRGKYSDTKVLFGYKYIPLRKEFFDISFDKRVKEKNLLIMSGGSDSCHAIEKILQKVENCDVDNIYAICGIYNQDYERLFDKYNKNSKINILKNVDNIQEYMLKADVCVSAAGNTMYELAACGTPTILYSISEYQYEVAENYGKRGLAEYVGDIKDGETVEKINRILDKYLSDDELRKQKSSEAIRCIDGRGSIRIAEEVISLCK